jgi:NDP-sugar pyrophosphorylase family protein
MRTAAILAGGLGTRLGALTAKVPKALLSVAGKPFIAYQLEYLRKQRFDRAVLCIGHYGEQIKEYVGDGARFGLEVLYAEDGDRLLGTGGALRQALPLLGTHFFVLYGDSYLPIDFLSVEACFLTTKQPALMTVLKNDGLWDQSNVVFAEGRLLQYDKWCANAQMRHIDYGLSIFSAEVFADLEPGSRYDLADLFHDLAMRGQLRGYEVFQRFYEIGSFAGLQDTIDYIHSWGK